MTLFLKVTKHFVLITGLILFVLLVNHSIISFNMMYPEQPLMYLVNQKIHHISDLFSIYLHPQLLHFAIPFFRPSGYFLMYQIVIPFFGWHNTQPLIVINLIFLALTGLMIIKFYNLLFPRFKTGGYIAFAIYLMHPALSLSRLIVLHFEFAYVFFFMLGLYFFAIFCQKNKVVAGQQLIFHSVKWLILAFVSYFLAATFKEPALILGPIMGAYFIIQFCGSNFTSLFQAIKKHKIIWQLLLLLCVSSITLVLYLTLAWPKMEHPFRQGIPVQEIMLTMIAFVKIIFCLGKGVSPQPHHYMPWRDINVPLMAHLTMNAFGLLFVAGSSLLCLKPSHFSSGEKRSLYFIFSAILLTLVLPVSWAMALPWHLSLTLLFLSLVMGFYLDYFTVGLLKNNLSLSLLKLSLAFMIALIALSVNKANVARYVKNSELNFKLTVTQNAVQHPPKLNGQLNGDSVLLVADGIIHDDYMMGASCYPFNLFEDQVNFIEKIQKPNFVKFHPSYNGTLFHWAYLNPTMHEELYPFDVNKLEMVPEIALYTWLQHADNIFSVRYDKQANWHDQTAEFKKNLFTEQKRRHLKVHLYQFIAALSLNKNFYKAINLPYDDARICQYLCDKEPQCLAFTYKTSERSNDRQCQFLSELDPKEKEFCGSCIGFLKTRKEIS